jgi:hypothetical protein
MCTVDTLSSLLELRSNLAQESGRTKSKAFSIVHGHLVSEASIVQKSTRTFSIVQGPLVSFVDLVSFLDSVASIVHKCSWLPSYKGLRSLL